LFVKGGRQLYSDALEANLSPQDLTCFGGGATKNDLFGFGGVAAKGRYDIAYLAHGTLTLKPTDFFTVDTLYAHAFGQGVMNANYNGKQGDYGFLEGLLAF
jgi:hypothetical protein